jgi:hypothetical protein
LVPLNMIPAGSAGWLPKGAGAPPEEDRSLDARASAHSDRALWEQRSIRAAVVRHRLMMAYRPLFEETAARVVRRERNDVGNKARQLLSKNDVPSFLLWLEDFYREHETFTAQQVRPLYRSYGEAISPLVYEEVGQDDRAARIHETREIPADVDHFIEAYVEEFARRSVAISRARLREIVEAALTAGGDPLEALEAELEEWTDKRAAETADWEPDRFNNAVAEAIYGTVGVAAIVWRAFGESCPYCRALDGRVVGMVETFLEAGEFQPDGAERPLRVSNAIGHAPAHRGCDCMTMAWF